MGQTDKPPPTLTPDGFAAAFRSASRKLWCVAAAILGGHAHAEDILQDAAITALQRLETFDARTNFEAWMGQIVRFTALNHSRRHYRTRELGDDWLDGAPCGPFDASGEDPFVGASAAMRSEQVHFDDAVLHALQRVAETPRACFLLRTLEDASYREIADLLGIPEGTAMSHVHRTRALLRRTLEADPVFEPRAAWRAS